MKGPRMRKFLEVEIEVREYDDPVENEQLLKHICEQIEMSHTRSIRGKGKGDFLIVSVKEKKNG